MRELKRNNEGYRSINQDDVNRACYKLVDLLKEWSRSHQGNLGGIVYPKDQMLVYSYPDEKDILIVGVGRDEGRFGDQPLFIDKDNRILTKDDMSFNDVSRLCNTFMSLIKNDRLKVAKESYKLESINSGIRDKVVRKFMDSHNKLSSLMKRACDEMDVLVDLRDELGDLIPDKTKKDIDYIYSSMSGLERMLRELRY